MILFRNHARPLSAGLLIFVGLFLGLLGAELSGAYTLTLLGNVFPIGEEPGVAVSGINESGQIVGTLTRRNAEGFTVSSAFLWKNSVFKDLGFLSGGNESAALGINDEGDVVGWSEAEASFTGSGSVPVTQIERHAFLWEGKEEVMIDLGITGDTGLFRQLDGGGSQAFAINNSGMVVGESAHRTLTAGTNPRAFQWQSGLMQDLLPIEGTQDPEMSARSLNDAGQIVGWVETEPFVKRTFILNGGIFTILGALSEGFINSIPHAINNDGRIVGYSEISLPNGSTQRHAVLWKGGELTDLTPTAVLNSDARDINNAGQVVGGDDFEGGLLWEDANKNGIFEAGEFTSLTELLPSDQREVWEVVEGIAINDAGSIVVKLRNLDGSFDFGNFLALLTPEEAGLQDPLNGISLGENFFFNDWYGIYNITFSPWLFHVEHGWQYVFPTAREDEFWFFDLESQDFWWTNTTFLPFTFYSFNRGAFVFYFTGTTNPRQFVDLRTEEFFTIP